LTKIVRRGFYGISARIGMNKTGLFTAPNSGYMRTKFGCEYVRRKRLWRNINQMRIEFTVKGRPPKKHGEKSMWARDDEARFVVSLRKKAHEARSEAGLDDCFRSLVALEIAVFAPRSRLEAVGDLDSFITGICDGLQAADSKVIPYLHKIFQEPGQEEIDPRHPLLIDNDAKVVSITARKVALDEDREIYYKVAVEPVQTAPSPNKRIKGCATLRPNCLRQLLLSTSRYMKFQTL